MPISFHCAAFVTLCLGFQGTPTKGAASYDERVDQILASVLTEDAVLRRGGVARLVELGPEAVPSIEKALRKGNHHRTRTAAIALGEMADEVAGLALGRFLKERKPGADDDVTIVAAYGAGGCSVPINAPILLSLIERTQEEPQVRLAAALGLARSTAHVVEKLPALFQQLSKRADQEPELVGALCVAIARLHPAVAKQRLPAMLKEAKDPVLRAGIWLGIALAPPDAPIAQPGSDPKSLDPVLSRLAVLAMRETPKKGDLSPVELRESRIASLGLGAGDADLMALATEERDPTLRSLWYGAAAARGWAEPLLRAPWPEASSGENGRFLAAAWMAFRGGFQAEQRTMLAEQARARWKKSADEEAGDAALLLAVLGDSEASLLLAPDAKEASNRPPAARIAWKFLQGELDKRRLEVALRYHAARRRVLPERWLSDACARYAGALLGHGSQFFERQSRVPFPKDLLLPQGLNRRTRSLPEGHEMFADLFHQIASTFFFAELQLPADDRG